MRFDEHPDWDSVDARLHEVGRLVRDSPQEGLWALVDLVDDLPDDRLCMVGVALIEPLLDMHTELVIDAFEEALRHHPNLRKALSCAWLSIDDGLVERLTDYIQPDENIGQQPSTHDKSVARWRSAREEPIRDVRLPELIVFLANASASGLTNSVDRGAVERDADPGAAHFLWPRFHCARGGQLPFYRCGLRLRGGVCEVDLLEADLRSLPQSDSSRVGAWLRIEMEKLPHIDEL